MDFSMFLFASSRVSDEDPVSARREERMGLVVDMISGGVVVW